MTENKTIYMIIGLRTDKDTRVVDFYDLLSCEEDLERARRIVKNNYTDISEDREYRFMVIYPVPLNTLYPWVNHKNDVDIFVFNKRTGKYELDTQGLTSF